MHSRLAIVSLLLGLIALATAASIPIPKRSFKVERQPNENFTGRNGPKALARAYRKHGMPVPRALQDALDMQNAARKRSSLENGLRKRKGNQGLPGFKPDGGFDAMTDGHSDKFGPFNGGGRPNGPGGNGNQGNSDTTPTSESSTDSNDQTGTVNAVPEENDAEYLSPVNIGGQTLHLDFDTGSSDLWVFNTQLGPFLSRGHSLFDPSKSDSFSWMQGANFSLSYGDGSAVKGDVGTDTVSIGGATVKSQAVELATGVSASFAEDQANDGLVGLAFSSINSVTPQKQKTFFDNVKDSLSEPLFTADLRKNATGTYEFGSVDTSKFQGDLTWIPVDSSGGFWQFTSESFAVGTGDSQDGEKNFNAIADTGTSLVLADPTAVKAYYKQVKGAQNSRIFGGFTFPCDADLPDLTLDIGGQYQAKISGDVINFAPTTEQGNECFGGVQATTVAKLGIYGDIMFKSQFVAFNGGNNTLGMAPHQ